MNAYYQEYTRSTKILRDDLKLITSFMKNKKIPTKLQI